LHLHILVWIKRTLSPEEIRQKILQPDSQFGKSLIEYLESAHSGDFITGSQDEVEENVEHRMADANYQDPTMTLPVAPPANTCKCESDKCEPCNQSKTLVGNL
jgi:hypothetical protein